MFFSSENLLSMNCSYHKGKLLVIRNLPFLGGGLILGGSFPLNLAGLGSRSVTI